MFYEKWYLRTGLNRRHSGCKPDALPLRYSGIKLLRQSGIAVMNDLTVMLGTVNLAPGINHDRPNWE